MRFVDTVVKRASGGGDLAEDLLGAINRCTSWSSSGDWKSRIKFMMLLTDAPTHGMVPPASAGVANADGYPVLHPDGLTAEIVVDNLMKQDIELFMCSFNPAATSRTEKELSQLYFNHLSNSEEREITTIPMVPRHSGSVELTGGHGKHIIFVLDESGSMSHQWAGVVEAYNQYLARRRQNQSESDLVSVVQFASRSRVTVRAQPLSHAPSNLVFMSGGTAFAPAALDARLLTLATPALHAPVVVFIWVGKNTGRP